MKRRVGTAPAALLTWVRVFVSARAMSCARGARYVDGMPGTWDGGTADRGREAWRAHGIHLRVPLRHGRCAAVPADSADEQRCACCERCGPSRGGQGTAHARTVVCQISARRPRISVLPPFDKRWTMARVGQRARAGPRPVAGVWGGCRAPTCYIGGPAPPPHWRATHAQTSLFSHWRSYAERTRRASGRSMHR